MSIKNKDQLGKRERTREMILDKALCLFQEQGFEKTTMRAIADACELSLGAAYYHFASKDALVLALYQHGADEAHVRNAVVLAGSKDFKMRLQAILIDGLHMLTPYRNLVGVLARQGADMSSPLSPFSPDTREIREEAIALFDAAIEGSNLKVAKAFRPELAKLLWLMQLGIVLFWCNDRSKNQQRTAELIELSLNALMPLLRATTLPFMGPIVNSLIRLIHVAENCLEPKLTSKEGGKLA